MLARSPAIGLFFRCIGVLVAASAAMGRLDAQASNTKDLELTIEFPDTIRIGEPTPMHLVAINRAQYVMRLDLTSTTRERGRPSFDIVVVDSTGNPVWHRAAFQRSPLPNHREVPLGARNQVELVEGASLHWWAVWDQRSDSGELVRAGKYRITGLVPEDDGQRLQTLTRTLTILP